jgi:rubrerythrin
MAIRFNADEILEIAEQIERNGADFYRAAARRAADDRSRDLFLDLARMEDEHERTFKGMRARFTAAVQDNAYDPDNEAVLYLQAFAGGHVFPVDAKPADALKGRETVEQILREAIGLEKDSIVFYLGVKDVLRKGKDQQALEAIISEEKRHVTALSRQLAEGKR